MPNRNYHFFTELSLQSQRYFSVSALSNKKEIVPRQIPTEPELFQVLIKSKSFAFILLSEYVAVTLQPYNNR
ncbi:hypothetical protein JCM15124A_08640 [Prevotella falsenii]